MRCTNAWPNHYLTYKQLFPLKLGVFQWQFASAMTALEQFFGENSLPRTIGLYPDNAKTHSSRQLNVSQSSLLNHSQSSHGSSSSPFFEELTRESAARSENESLLCSQRHQQQIPSSFSSISLVKDKMICCCLPKKASSFTLAGSYQKVISQQVPRSLFRLGSPGSSHSRWNDSSEELLPISPIRRASFENVDLHEAVARVEEFTRQEEEQGRSNRINGDDGWTRCHAWPVLSLTRRKALFSQPMFPIFTCSYYFMLLLCTAPSHLTCTKVQSFITFLLVNIDCISIGSGMHHGCWWTWS